MDMMIQVAQRQQGYITKLVMNVLRILDLVTAKKLRVYLYVLRLDLLFQTLLDEIHACSSQLQFGKLFQTHVYIYLTISKDLNIFVTVTLSVEFHILILIALGSVLEIEEYNYGCNLTIPYSAPRLLDCFDVPDPLPPSSSAPAPVNIAVIAGAVGGALAFIAIVATILVVYYQRRVSNAESENIALLTPRTNLRI